MTNEAAGATNEAAGKAWTYLHHQAKVSDIISLRLHQLQQNVTMAKKKQTQHLRNKEKSQKIC